MAAFGVSKLLKREQDNSPLENYPRKTSPYTIASQTNAPQTIVSRTMAT